MSQRTVEMPTLTVGNGDHSEYLMLISFELDGMLDEEEKGRLDRHLKLCSHCSGQRQLWQVIDRRLAATPTPEPAPGFSQAVIERIERRERLRNLRVGLLLAVLTVFVWSLALAGIGLLASALVYANLDHFSAAAQFLGEARAMAEVVWQSLWGIVVESTATTTTVGIASAYTVVVVAALAGWCIFIQRTTQPVRSRVYDDWSQSSL